MSEELTLPESARAALAEKFPELDLATVRFVEGLPFYARFAAVEPAALTWAGAVYLAPGQFHPGTEDGLAILVHELVHIRQQREAGLFIFALRYFLDYFWNLVRTLNRAEAYRAIRYEAEAREIAGR